MDIHRNLNIFHVRWLDNSEPSLTGKNMKKTIQQITITNLNINNPLMYRTLHNAETTYIGDLYRNT